LTPVTSRVTTVPKDETVAPDRMIAGRAISICCMPGCDLAEAEKAAVLRRASQIGGVVVGESLILID